MILSGGDDSSTGEIDLVLINCQMVSVVKPEWVKFNGTVTSKKLCIGLVVQEPRDPSFAPAAILPAIPHLGP
jgi:hypothetical protein